MPPTQSTRYSLSCAALPSFRKIIANSHGEDFVDFCMLNCWSVLCLGAPTLELLSKPFKWYSFFFLLCFLYLYMFVLPPKLRTEIYLFTIYGPI